MPAWEVHLAGLQKKGRVRRDLKYYIPGMGMNGGGNSAAIPQNAPHPAAALVFIDWLTSADTQTDFNVTFGACAISPENTLASVREAARLGAKWIETDVRLTADMKQVMIHDETLDRTSNGRGPVRNQTLAEIQKLDSGSWFFEGFAGRSCPVAGRVSELYSRKRH